MSGFFQDEICQKLIEKGYKPEDFKISKEPYNGWKIKAAMNFEDTERTAKEIQEWIDAETC